MKTEKKLKKLPAKAVKENVAVLEDLFLNCKLDFSWLDSSYSARDAQIVDIAIATLAQYGNNVILADVFKDEELDHGCNYDSMTIKALTDIYSLWVDKKAIIAREDNLLNSPDMTNPHWKKMFDHELAKLMTSKGKLMAHYRSVYGWEDYIRGENKLPEIVAVFNVKSDYWGEFSGTFVTEDDSKSGFTAHVMFKDGMFRDLRYEAGISEIMNELG
jgi:hypothetical protein